MPPFRRTCPAYEGIRDGWREYYREPLKLVIQKQPTAARTDSVVPRIAPRVILRIARQVALRIARQVTARVMPRIILREAPQIAYRIAVRVTIQTASQVAPNIIRQVSPRVPLQVMFRTAIGTTLGTVPGVTPRATRPASQTAADSVTYPVFRPMTRVSFIGIMRRATTAGKQEGQDQPPADAQQFVYDESFATSALLPLDKRETNEPKWDRPQRPLRTHSGGGPEFIPPSATSSSSVILHPVQGRRNRLTCRLIRV
jgi:hypothetical protein